MERMIRLAAPVGGAALAISLLVGVISGVAFGAVILRALISGVVFGALAAGLSFALPRLLPGIDGASSGSAGDGDRSDEDIAAAESAPAEAPPSGSRLNIVVDDSADASPEDVDESDDEESGGADLVEEVEESAAENESEVMSAAISEEQDGSSVEIDDTMLDEMPDIGSFAGSFVSQEGVDDEDAPEDSSFGAPASGGGSPQQSVRVGNQGVDPKTIAKALRTTMSRDSDG